MPGRVIVSLKDKKLSDEEKKIISHPMTAGIILFARNCGNSGQLRELLGEIQYIAIAAGKTKGIPIFADQEGGFVQRLGVNCTKPLPAPEVFGTTYEINKETGLKLAYEYGKRMASYLKPLGIISLSPVLDLDAGNKVISGLGRAFHSDPASCTKLAEAYIDGMNSEGLKATAKHFPGHGQNIGDSHEMTPVDGRTLQEIECADLLPFISLIEKNKLSAVMPAHIKYSKIDPENPAGMSKIWLKDILREKYNFQGQIVSDCLSMAGAGDEDDLTKVKRVLDLGCIALLCNKKTEEVLNVLNNLDFEKYKMSEQEEKRFDDWVGGCVPMHITLAKEATSKYAEEGESLSKGLIFSQSNPESMIKIKPACDTTATELLATNNPANTIQPKL